MCHMPRATAYIKSSRHFIFYFRINVPSSARFAVVACTHIRRSLRNKNWREVVLLGTSLLDQVGSMFCAAELGKVVDFQALTRVSAKKQVVVSVTDGPIVTLKKRETCRQLLTV